MRDPDHRGRPRGGRLSRKALRESGHVADHAGDGEDGLAHGAERRYDVLVVDRMLPRSTASP